MERNFEVIGDILRALKGCEHEGEFDSAMEKVGDTHGLQTVQNQIRLLQSAGLIEAWTPDGNAGMFGPHYINGSAKGYLTWKGHDFGEALSENGGDYRAAIEEVMSS